MLKTVERPRTIVCADPELDDLNSMIRLLLYSNDVQIDGLVYASSRYHWKGDGAGTPFFAADREYAIPQTSWRWAAGERFIDDIIDAYQKVHSNLVVHDPRYPSADLLRSVVREGNVTFEGDISSETPGSRLIADALLDDRPGPLHLQVWAGTSTIARALLSIQEEYGGSADWPELRERVSAKARITKFDSQDATYDEYIRPYWPKIRVTEAKTWTWGYSARHLVLPDDAYLLSSDWMREHVTSAGPLGALYRTWGDGRRMVEGDPTDFFHLSGRSVTELEASGYTVWTEPQSAGEWISEGDTSTMLNLFPAGLRAHEHPTRGGWGGRAQKTPASSDEWSVELSQDRAPSGDAIPEYSVSRWFGDAQRDFAARLRWSVTPTFGDAAHHPVITAISGPDLLAEPGAALPLVVDATAPDGGELRFRWWHYRDAGTLDDDVLIEHLSWNAVTARIPETAAAGDTIHIILEVENVSPAFPMKTYARIIVTIAG